MIVRIRQREGAAPGRALRWGASASPCVPAQRRGIRDA